MYLTTYLEVYCKELVLVTREAEKSQSESCGEPGKLVMEFQSEPKGQRTRGAGGIILSLCSAGRWGAKGQVLPTSRLYSIRALRDGRRLPPLCLLRRAICLPSPRIQILTSTRSVLLDTPETMFLGTLGQSSLRAGLLL